MTRAVNATLHAALQAGTGKIIAKVYVGYSDGSVSFTATASAFKLTGTTLQVTIPVTTGFADNQTHFWLERGLTIAGTDYTITTGRFAIHNKQFKPNKVQVISGGLFPNTYYSVNAYASYDTVINAFCTAFGKTAVYREAGEAWHAYKFLGLGQYIVMPDAMSILPLLQQKRMIQMCDIGSEQVLVFCTDVYGATDLSITIKDNFTSDQSAIRNRQFVWKDEVNVYHQAGTATDPIHNLGYMEAAASAPARKTSTHQLHAIIRPDLRMVDGDRISFTMWGTSTSSCFARISEEYAADSKDVPQWRTIVDANTVFNNTEGGQVQASIEKTAHYVPINPSAFDHLLTAKDNNLQHALDTLDDHSHTPIVSFVIGASGIYQTVPAGTTYYMFGYVDGVLAALPNFVWPIACTISNFYFRNVTAQPASGSLVVTLYLNNNPTTLTITIPANGGSQNWSDTTHVITVAAGDLLRFYVQNNAAVASAQVSSLSIQITPT